MLLYNLLFTFIFFSCCVNTVLSKDFNNIKIIGNKRIPKETILYQMDLKTFNTSSQSSIDKLIKNLYSQGFFSNVSITKNVGDQITVNVEENPIVQSVTIVGNKKIKDLIIKSELQTKEGAIYSKFQLDTDIKKIKATYRKLGYLFISINYSLKKRNTETVEVIFFLQEGKQPKISSINFYGNKNFLQTKLKKIIASQERSWYRFLSSRDLYNADRIALDKELLRQFYMQRGYVNFNITSSILEMTSDIKSFVLNYILNEGDVFYHGESNILCKISGINSDKLIKLIKYRKGDIFNQVLIEKIKNDMTHFLVDQGFTFITVDYHFDKDVTKKLINISFIISETSKYFTKYINISGNSRTLDRIIRRELTIHEGDPFHLSKIEVSRQKISNLGYFNSVSFQNKYTSHSDTLNIDIKVKEALTGSMRFAIGYNTTEGVIASTTLSESNFLGKGQIIEIDFSKARKNSELSLSFTEPKFMDRNLALGFDIHSRVQRKNRGTLNLDSIKSKGISLRMGYDVHNNIYHKIDLSIKNENSNKKNNIIHFFQSQSNKTTISSLGHSVIFNTLDSRFNPTKGYSVELGQIFAGIGGNVKYLKNELNATYYKSFYKNKIILHLIGRTANIKGLYGKYVNINDNYFVGEEYIRGFDVSGIGPRKQNKLKDYQESIGGKKLFTSTTEIQIPKVFSDILSVKGVIFIDMGTLFNTDISKYECNTDDKCNKLFSNKYIYDSKKIRSSCGIGLIWYSPIGLIKLDYGVPLRKELFDNISKVRFSIGKNF